VEGSIQEIDYALDHLGAKGFALLTNSNGIYLGDPLLDKVFTKLDERKAVVMIHPTTCHLCQSSDSHRSQNIRAEASSPLPQYPRPMLEFFFDTARAIVHLILSRSVERHPNITFIVPHCGSVLPSVVERFTSYSTKVCGKNGISGDSVREIFKTRFYFDLAGFPFPDQIHGLLRFAGASRFLYGTDFPFLPADAVIELAEKNDTGIQKLFDAEESSQIYYENARRLLALD
jgi:predicted TIM-barrel fold metal-dependent hydrolase